MATKNVDPKKSAAAKKAAATRRANREAAARREQETISSRNWNWLPWVLLGAVIIGMLIWRPWTNATAAPAPVPTEAPVVSTEVPVVVVEPTPIPMPVAVTCDTPSIKASKDGVTFQEFGEYLNTELGERMTFTNRKVIVPTKAWNEKLTDLELKDVEVTWLFMQVCIPQGTYGRLFAGGYEQKLYHYDNGVYMTLKPGYYEFKMRNGEFIVWYPGQESPARKDVDRVVDQILHGNFDIHGELAYFGTTTDLLPVIPTDLVKTKNVQIVPAPEPMVK